MGRKNRKKSKDSNCCDKIDYAKLNLWKKIEDELQSAMVVLMQDHPNPALEKEYQEFLDHNEFELAYLTLKKLGESAEQLPDFGEHLEAAAHLMRTKLPHALDIGSDED